jgi:hypothetical protein
VENVLDHLKVSTSVMFAVTANGTLLPPYVCYKSLHIYNTWIQHGLTGTCYNRTQSGWFTAEIFNDWFESRLSGCKVLIGDNLCSHISFQTIKLAMKYNIDFVFLVPNSTHLTQPLDFSVFKPLKVWWGNVLKKYKRKNRWGTSKKCFSRTAEGNAREYC